MTGADLGSPGALGNVFGGSAAGALSGRLPPKPPGPTAADADTEAQRREAQRRAREEREAQERREREAQEQQAAQDAADQVAADDDTFQTSVYLLSTAWQAAAKLRTRRGLTNAAIAFDAIDSVQHDLSALLAARRGVDRPAGSLFPTRRGPSARTTATGQGIRRKLWTIQTTERELAVVDALCAEHGAASRSELISTAVEAFLLPARGARRGEPGRPRESRSR